MTDPAVWPPTLADLKKDLKVAESDTRDDDRYTMYLNASVDFVVRIHGTRYNFTGDLGSTLRDVTHDLTLGTIRLAGRWNTRTRSPDGLVQMGDLGAARVSSGDPDIDRLLRIGRHTVPVVG